jgi:hypothetical protein
MRVRRRLPPIVLATVLACAALAAPSAASTPVPRTPANAPLVPAHHARHHAGAPSITGQPASDSVTVAATVTFSAKAAGKPKPRVKWELSTNHGRSWRVIAGADTRKLSFSALLAENGYEYRAVFVNSAGRATTRAATLTVTSPPPQVSTPPPTTPANPSPPVSATPSTSAPAVTSQPASTDAADGASVRFSATASGNPAPSVQWEVSTDGGTTWDDVNGATSTTYTFTAMSSENGDEYRAVFSNSAGTATSAAATLTIMPPTAPAITQQPSDQTAGDGASATFSAAASGSPVPSVQWQVSSDGGTDWTDVAGATSATYSFTASSGENGYEYRAVFTNSVTSATTDSAVLTVAEESSNWAGYYTQDATFTSVSASWTVAAVSCGSQTAYSSQWIGIDGATSGSESVEQDGTEADCSPHEGSSYNAWYEMYGDTQDYGEYYDEVPVSNCAGDAACPVSPGDQMSASVSVSDSDWTLSIDDTTEGWTFTTTIDSPTPVPAQSSAEWIIERPDVGGDLPALANFGTDTFTDASASTGGASEPISSFSYTPIEMLSNSGDTVLAAPGPLSTDGTTFATTWDAAGP